jgi:hypothetical protein
MRSQGVTVLVCLIGLALSALCASTASAQTGLGIVINIASTDCGPLQYPYPEYPGYFRNFDTTMTNCYSATLANCPNNVADMNFVYAYAPAQGTPLGTIVMFSGDGGEYAATGPNFPKYASYYEGQGYQVVEVAWGGLGTQGTAWEIANPGSPTTSPSFLYAACRPATFLNWVRNGNSGVGGGIWSKTKGGMCVHANSGGAGAVGYALTWYNGGTGGSAAWGQGYIDKAVLENGPVFSDVKRGCEINQSGYNGQATTICASGTSQIGCQDWTVSVAYPLEYQFGDQNSVNVWSGNPSSSPACGNI